MNTAMLKPTLSQRKRIIAFLLARYKLTAGELFSEVRTNELVWARWVGFMLFRSSGFTLEATGDTFKKKHSSVSHGLRKLKLLITVEKGCAADWSEAKAEFGATTPNTSRPA